MLWVGMILAMLQDDAATKLNDSGKKASEWKSYRFKVDSKIDGLGGKEPGPMEGTFEKDKGLYVKGGRLEAVKVGDKTAITDKEGGWTLVNPEAKGDEKKKGQGRANLVHEPPHGNLENLGAKFAKIETAQDGENTVYSGELTPAGAADLMGAQLKKLAKNGEFKGTAKVTVNKDGQIVTIEINGSVKGKVKDQEVNATFSKTVTYSDVDAATLTIPEGAKKVLEQP